MTTLLFYEKPGCGNNARQKTRLRAAGHELVVRDLLSEPWNAARLRAFFAELPVADWFNRAAPRVKSGEVEPDRMDAQSALTLMLADPLLIRRPLIEATDLRSVGFDAAVMTLWLGPDHAEVADEACPRAARGDHQPCPPPSAADRHGIPFPAMPAPQTFGDSP